MLGFTLGVALVAMLIAFAARAKAKGLEGAIEELRRDARRRAENHAEAQAGELGTLRNMLAVLAGGGELTPEMVLEGRLWRDVDARAALELANDPGLRVLDVRSPQETAGGVLANAILIPIDQLEARAGELAKDGRPTLVYCAGGGRSAAACEFLSQQGHTGLMNLAGGISSWTGKLERPR